MKIDLMEHKEDLDSSKGTIRMKDTELRTTNILSWPQTCRDDDIVSSGQMRKWCPKGSYLALSHITALPCQSDRSITALTCRPNHPWLLPPCLVTPNSLCLKPCHCGFVWENIWKTFISIDEFALSGHFVDIKSYSMWPFVYDFFHLM